MAFPAHGLPAWRRPEIFSGQGGPIAPTPPQQPPPTCAGAGRARRPRAAPADYDANRAQKARR
eukprot:1713517-Alexandrium_andersonii.AAC.1